MKDLILIAPDKFKGTLSAADVCRISREVFDEFPRLSRSYALLCCPMADGGEGTSEIVLGQGATPGFAIIDSSSVIGREAVRRRFKTVMTADSHPLGAEVGRMLSRGCERVYVAVGGTGTCDGGVGFVRGIAETAPKDCHIADRVVGLCDVAVPLVAPDGEPSALMFAPQKGASHADMPMLRTRLEQAAGLTSRRSIFDGAGGGLGFALASVLGCRCMFGAEFVLGRYDIDWSRIALAVTGEGSVDEQTERGKVVKTVYDAARRHDVPVAVMAGVCRSASGLPGAEIYATSSPEEVCPTPEVAARRLAAAFRRMFAQTVL